MDRHPGDGRAVRGQAVNVTQDSFATFLPANAESTKVLERQEAFPGGNSSSAAVIYYRPSGVTDADRAQANEDLRALANSFGGNGAGARVVPAQDGKALVYQIPISLAGVQDEGTAQQTAVKAIRSEVGTGSGDLQIKVTGPAGIVVDSQEVFEGLEFTLVLVPVLVVAILLIIIYRSPVLFILPLIGVGVAYQVGSAAVYGLVQGPGLVLNSLGAGILGILVYGAGTDYALLLIARYREELRREADRHVAMATAIRRSGPALVASAATVALGLICLLAADSRSTRALGPVSAIAIVGVLVSVLTLLPALLVITGRWVFWPFTPKVGDDPDRVPRLASRRRDGLAAAPHHLADHQCAGGDRLVRPVQPQHPGADNVPGDARVGAGAGADRGSLPGRSGHSGRHHPPADRPTRCWRRHRPCPASPRYMRSPGPAGPSPIRPQWTPRPTPEREYTAIRALRDRVHPDNALVGGRSAITMDLDATNRRDASVLIPLVLVAILAILALLLRALVAPVLMIMTVLLSFGAALGISVTIFERVFGWSGQDANLPVLSFVFLVALGVDYNIFLMSRVREESALVGTRLGTVRGLVVTGGVITSAGIVLAATFSVLAALPVINVSELGFVVALGVLVDTLIVRSLLLPALTVDIGPRMWWPSRLGPADEGRHRTVAPESASVR